MKSMNTNDEPNTMPIILNSSSKIKVCKIENLENIQNAFLHILPSRILILEICVEYGKEREEIISFMYENCYEKHIKLQHISENMKIVDSNYKGYE